MPLNLSELPAEVTEILNVTSCLDFVAGFSSPPVSIGHLYGNTEKQANIRTFLNYYLYCLCK